MRTAAILIFSQKQETLLLCITLPLCIAHQNYTFSSTLHQTMGHFTHLCAGGVGEHVLAVGVTNAVHMGDNVALGVQHLWSIKTVQHTSEE